MIPCSKIASLPATMRAEINQRLEAGQPSHEILDWLNAQPAAREVLARSWQGKLVTEANLRKWRACGKAASEEDKTGIALTRGLAIFAGKQSAANRARLAEGAATLAGRKLLELLVEATDNSAPDNPANNGGPFPSAPAAGDRAVENTLEAASAPKKLSLDQIVKIAAAACALRTTEQNAVRLRQNQRRLRQLDRKLELERDKYQRDATVIALEMLHDEAAKQIEANDSNLSYEQRIEVMGRHIFGDLWLPRDIPGVDCPPVPPSAPGPGDSAPDLENPAMASPTDPSAPDGSTPSPRPPESPLRP